MRHPLEFVPDNSRKAVFFALLAGTLILFAVFRILDDPLRTPAAPNGIVSFELAGTTAKAQAILDSWQGAASFTSPPISFALFGLGLDYLFMPLYAGALSLAVLIVSVKHNARLKGMGALIGWGIFAAALFDGVENYALTRMLLMNQTASPLPEVAAACATVKFAILFLGLIYLPLARFWPPKK